MAKALTAASILKLKADPSRRREVPDGILPGLYFVIQPTGRKSWAVRYRAGSTPKKITLGNALFGSDADAAGEELTRVRIEAAQVLERVRRGEDPGAAKQADKRRAKDKNAADLTDSGPSSSATCGICFERRNFPEKARLLGMRRKAEVGGDPGRPSPCGAAGVYRILPGRSSGSLDDLPRRADRRNRAFAEFRKFFKWADGKGIVTTSPVTGLQRPSEENAAERVLASPAGNSRSSDTSCAGYGTRLMAR